MRFQTFFSFVADGDEFNSVGFVPDSHGVRHSVPDRDELRRFCSTPTASEHILFMTSGDTEALLNMSLSATLGKCQQNLGNYLLEVN